MKPLLAAALLTTLAAFSAGHVLAMTPCEAVTGTNKCVTPQPFQPNISDLEFVTNIYDTTDDNLEFKMYGHNQRVIVVNGVPFAQYWLRKEKTQHVFHPMIYGRYIF